MTASLTRLLSFNRRRILVGLSSRKLLEALILRTVAMGRAAMSSNQGSEFADFLKDELANEISRRDSVNSRAATAITSATGLVTLVLAVVAVAKGKDYIISGAALAALVVALVALLLSAVAAIIAGLNWKYMTVSTGTMRRMVQDKWATAEVDARNATAYCNLIAIESLRRATTVKFRFLIGASIGQIVAILSLSATTLLVVVL